MKSTINRWNTIYFAGTAKIYYMNDALEKHNIFLTNFFGDIVYNIWSRITQRR